VGSDFVPIQVKSGIRKGSEEGTEVVVKYVESVRRKGPFHYTQFLPDHHILFPVWLILWFVSFWYSVFTQYWTPFLIVAVVLTPLFVFLSVFAYITRKKVWIMVDEEKQKTIFFPNVSIANITDVKEVDDRGVGWDSEWPPEWRDIVRIDHNHTGEVWVEGEGDDGGTYRAKFYCPDLYDRVKHDWKDYQQQLKQKAFEEHKGELEYLEKVGRYEEAARIYEKLGMPEKAGEMRRKKREIVALDLNALIRQLGERGFTITYSCSHCGAPVSISGETKTEAIQYCSHCGSRIETIDLARFIKKYLS